MARILITLGITALLVSCSGNSDPAVDAGSGAEIDGGAQADAMPGDGDGGTGSLCGGFIGETCTGENFCDFPSDICGGDDAQGRCSLQPQDCLGEEQSVCACDGQVYSSACAAAQAGHDVSILSACDIPVDHFRCGALFCKENQEYCRRGLSDVGGYADEYACIALPICPGNLSCSVCLDMELCGDSCEEVEGHFTLTCPGG